MPHRQPGVDGNHGTTVAKLAETALAATDPPTTEVILVQLLPRLLRRETLLETKCARCGTPAPPEDVECTVCRWDLSESYHDPTSGVDREPEKVERSQLGRHPRAF